MTFQGQEKQLFRGELSDLVCVYFYLYLAICSPTEDAYLQKQSLSPFGPMPNLEKMCH